MATIKEELPVLGIKASSHHIRQIAITCGKLPSRVAAALAWRGALSSSPSSLIFNQLNNIILSTNSSYVILPCNTNTN